MVRQQTKAITATRSTRTTKAQTSDASSPASQDDIAERAYEIWTQRGGDAMENWLTAEAELNCRKTPASRSRTSRS
jgi:hypothetical protein